MPVSVLLLFTGGFQLYDRIHFGWLLSICLVVSILTRYYRQASLSTRLKIRKSLACIILAMEIVKDLYHVSQGTFSFYYLPLHLCSLAIFIVFWHAFLPTKTNKEMLYALVFPGALAALIFPEWTTTAIFSYMHNHSFIIHGLLIAYPILLLATGELVPDWRQLHKVAIALSITAFPIYFFNKYYDLNFMFLNTPSPGSPLVLLEQWFGNPGYLIGFAGLIIVVWFVMYAPVSVMKKVLYRKTHVS
ncbi:hypothetical protein AEA09_05320 [Lysinibacillus contaminans]|uniref:ABC transporter permease n=1 Tax=Lysinibacillus contaminans TaxID=1293441 RepID=A0ABR5JZD7_9BACI|nr:YwaF family protein [Lysinibacillus contaminans]KOS68028.1 hypothetical protein AEA09_05320 [Lysinibacillus contaminans]